MVRAGLVVFALLIAGAALSSRPTVVRAAGESGYPWPLKPFDRPHPVRAVLGDPRTVFAPTGGDLLSGPGRFSFHNGVDIDAPRGTAVYPVVSGTARWIVHDGVLIKAADGRMFMYRHIEPAVERDQAVTARETVIGYVRNWEQELHFTELTAEKKYVNPLLHGHLTPYADRTRPTVVATYVQDARGRSLHPVDVHGQVTIIVDAYDTPDRRIRFSFPLSRFAHDGFPVVPAALSWSLSDLDGRIVMPERTVVDFRGGIPDNKSFWRVYSRGTYQNRPAIGTRFHSQMPGRYLFRLTPSLLDTRSLRDGVYVVTVTVVDVRGNRRSFADRIEVRNGSSGSTR